MDRSRAADSSTIRTFYTHALFGVRADDRSNDSVARKSRDMGRKRKLFNELIQFLTNRFFI